MNDDWRVRVDFVEEGVADALQVEEWRPADAPPRARADRSAHRWKYVLLGATDEDSADELAERVRAEVPPGSKVAVEGTWRDAYAERPRSPFAFLGGLAE